MNGKIIFTQEQLNEFYYINAAIEIAKKATCLRSKCGAIIVKNGEIIGKGFNSPPKNLESQRRCKKEKSEYTEKITDKTCCIHAEQRAVTDALMKNPTKLEGSTLFFARLDLQNNFLYAGEPYCTICSKFVLDTGIKKFILWHERGMVEYDTQEYNDISFS